MRGSQPVAVVPVVVALVGFAVAVGVEIEVGSQFVACAAFGWTAHVVQRSWEGG